MRRLLLLNLNLDPTELHGCTQISAAMREVDAQVTIAHFATWPDATGFDGVVLGPQGTPFAAYPLDFLSNLRQWSLGLRAPVLAICGGMQALALAHGGQLGGVDGGPQAQGLHYGEIPRISGPTAVALTAALPSEWQGPAAAELRQLWKIPQLLWQSHAEQLTVLPPAWMVLAHSVKTPVEAYTVAEKRWLGCQFHAERGWLGDETACPAGKLLLAAWTQNLG